MGLMLIPCGKMPTPRGVMGMAHGEMLRPAKPNEMAATARKPWLCSVMRKHSQTPQGHAVVTRRMMCMQGTRGPLSKRLGGHPLCRTRPKAQTDPS